MKKKEWKFIKVKPNDDSLLTKLQARFWEKIINEEFEKALREDIEKTLKIKL